MATSKLFPIVLGGLLLTGSALANAPSCPAFMAQAAIPSMQVSTWRVVRTNGDLKQTPSSPEREAWINGAAKAMKDYLYADTDTPEMIFAQAEGITAKVTETKALENKRQYTLPINYTKNVVEQAYHFDQIARIEISGLPSSGELKGTLLLPVSGHTGIPNAEKWAKTDTYSVYLENAQGQRLATLAENAKSQDMITFQEISAKIEAGKVYRLTYYRSGSGGPAGYPNGRIYEIIWDGK